MTDAAYWLNTTFAGFDHALLQSMHTLAEWGGWFLTPIFIVLSYLGKYGLIELVLAVVLLSFKKTRMVGICMIVALALGALITNATLKELIARPRLYTDMSSDYYQWWQYVGAVTESDYSFPSGHVTAAMASMTALFLSTNKRISWLAFVFVVVMAVDRMYLMVHYPTDVIAGILVGALAGVLACFIVKRFKKYWKARKKKQAAPKANSIF